MRFRWQTWLLILSILFVLGVIALGLWAKSTIERAMIGPKHEFELADRPAFLTEDLAMLKARETLQRDVPDAALWEARPDDRSAAPDGRQDKYLCRNTVNPNQGRIKFRGPNDQYRYVRIELLADRIVCQSERLK
jgi:hypothetical protein